MYLSKAYLFAEGSVFIGIATDALAKNCRYLGMVFFNR